MNESTRMTSQEILERAITKAIKGGWVKLNAMRPLGFRNYIDEQRVVKISANDDGIVGSEYFNVEAIIFNHDFARALWGEDRVGIKAPGTRLDVGAEWQYHLQCMVVADDPIAYLAENI